MENIVAHRIIRLVNRTQFVALPADYIRETGLLPGDHVVMIREADGLRLRFIKTQAREPEPPVEAA
jgi:hypothetical protein